MQDRRRIAVIGAGVIGLNVAWRLAEQGASVTLVDAERPGGGTSSTSFAWVNASSKAGASEAYFRLNAMAVAAHREIGMQPGAWFMPTGDIELAAGDAGANELNAKVERLKRRGYAAELLSDRQLQALEPGTRMPPHGAGAFYPEEGWVDVGNYVAALLSQVRRAGAVVVTNDPAQQVMQANGTAGGVRLASGATIEADAVVIAVGRWTAAFAARLGIDVPLVGPDAMGSKAVGLLAWVRPGGDGPRRLVHAGAVNWSPLSGGRALLASDDGDAAVAADRSPEAARSSAETLVAQAAAHNPLFAGAAVEQHKIGVRALPKDGLTVCGWAREVGSLYVLVTHSGVTLSPLLGRLAVGEILAEHDEPILSQFRPHRFRRAGE